MRVRFVTSALEPSAGGPFQSIGGLARHLAVLPETEVEVTGLVPRRTGWREHRANWSGCRLTVCEGGPLHRIGCVMPSRQLAVEADRPDIMHFGELWNAVAVLQYRVTRRTDRVIVHSPRGMLEPWSLRHHAVRKKIAWVAGQRRVLGRVDLFHATSKEEVDSIRASGFRQPVALIPNAVAIHDPPGPRARSGGERMALALGRLHPKKGFADLIRAWRRTAPRHWRLVIAGPDEGSHLADLRQLVASEGGHRVELWGPQYGVERMRLLNQADLFICSSYSENFGLVVAEAMERSLAVIATTGTPWRCLAQKGMGWWVEPGVDGLTGALAEALELPQSDLDRRGAAGRRYVEANLGWPAAALAMREAYRWVLGGGSPPATIHLP